MGALDDFSVFKFGEGVPHISVTKYGVTFNKSVIIKLNYPQYVVLWVNAEKKQIAIKRSKKGEPNSVVFYKNNGSDKILPVRWNNKNLLYMLEATMEWKLEESSYRADGFLIKEEDTILFDFSKTASLQ